MKKKIETEKKTLPNVKIYRKITEYQNGRKIDETSQNKAHLFKFKNSIQKNKTLINVHKPTNCSTFQVCLSHFLSKIKKKENKKHPITKHKILIVPDLTVKY